MCVYRSDPEVILETLFCGDSFVESCNYNRKASNGGWNTAVVSTLEIKPRKSAGSFRISGIEDGRRRADGKGIGVQELTEVTTARNCGLIQHKFESIVTRKMRLPVLSAREHILRLTQILGQRITPVP